MMLALDKGLKGYLPSLSSNPISKYISASDIIGAASKIVSQADRNYIFDNMKFTNLKLYELGLAHPKREDLALAVGKLGAKWEYFFRLGSGLNIKSLEGSAIVQRYLRKPYHSLYLSIDMFLERDEESLETKPYWDKRWGPNPGPLNPRSLATSSFTIEFLLQHHDQRPFKGHMKRLLEALSKSIYRYNEKYYNHEIIKLYLPDIPTTNPQLIDPGTYKLNKGQIWSYNNITILKLSNNSLLIGGQLINFNEDNTYVIKASDTLYRFILKPSSTMNVDLVNDTLVII